MKPGSSAVGTAIVAALTLVIGFVLGTVFGTEESQAPVVPGGAPRAASPAARNLLGDAPDSAPVRRTAAEAQAVPANYTVSEAEFARAAAGIEATPATPNTGGEQITGRVGTLRGEPLEGVVVVATLRQQSDPYGTSTAKVGSGRPTDSTLEETLRQGAESWAGTRGRRYNGVTVADGSYVIAGLPEGRFSVSAYHEGFVVSRSGSNYSVLAGGSADFTAREVAVLHAEVRRPDGSAPELAAIHIKKGGNRGRNDTLRWTRDNPVLRVSRPEGRAVAKSDFVTEGDYGRYAPPRMQSEPVELREGVENLTFDLRPTRGVYGRILGSNRIGRDSVRLLDLSKHPDRSAEAFKRDGLRSEMLGTVFQYLDLESGSYAIGLLGGNDALLAQAECVVTDGLTECLLEIPEPSSADSVRVLCLSPDGFPLHDVSFSYQMQSGGGTNSSSVNNPKRDADGAYWLPAAQMNLKTLGRMGPEESLTITGTHAHFGRCMGVVTGTQTELTMQFTEPCSLTVVVPGYEQSPLRGKLRVSVSELRDGKTPAAGTSLAPSLLMSQPSHNEQQEVGKDGRVTFLNVTKGRCKVSLLVSNQRWGGRRIGELEITLSQREQEVRIPIPALHEVVFSGPGMTSGTHLWINRKRGEGDAQHHYFSGNDSFSGRLDDQLQYVASDVPAGTYVVHANGLSKPMEIVVPGGPYILEAPKIDCLKVAISDADGPMARAGLQPGDLVVEINGTAVASKNWWEVLQTEGSKKNVPLTVLRNGQRTTVQGGDFVWQSTDAGGTFTPASTEGD